MSETAATVGKALADIRKDLDDLKGRQTVTAEDIDARFLRHKAELVAAMNESNLQAAAARASVLDRSLTTDDAAMVRWYSAVSADEVKGQILTAGKAYTAPRHDSPDSCWYRSDKGILRLTYGTVVDQHGKALGFEYGLLDDPRPTTEWQKQLQDLVDLRSLIRAFQSPGSKFSPTIDRRIARHIMFGPDAIRKIWADSSGIGAEWVPDNTFPQVLRDIRLARRVEALFPSIVVPPGGSLLVPYGAGGLTPYIAGVPSSDDPANFRKTTAVTEQRSWATKKQVVATQLDEDFTEDAVAGSAEFIRSEMVAAHVDGAEDAIINSDTGTHQDTALNSWNPRSRWASAGLGVAGDHRRNFIGLRARAFDNSNTVDGDSAKGNISQFATALSSLDSPLGVGAGVVHITSPEHVLSNLFGITELQTLDKYGPNAVVLSGEVAKVNNRPIIMSEFVTNDLVNTGLYTSASNTTCQITVATNRWWVADRSSKGIRMATDIENGTIVMTSSRRWTFQSPDASTKKSVHVAFKL